MYQRVTGNVTIVARVDALVDTYPWAKAGVMVRNDLTAGAANALMSLSAEHGVAFQRRDNSGALTITANGPAATPPTWVRIVRTGTTVTGYTSTNGSTWTRVGSDTVALGATAYVGLAVTSHDTSTPTTAKMSHVSVLQPLPSPEKDADIGAPAARGGASYVSGSYTVTAGGTDIWGTADQFHFVYQAITGDVDVVARVASIANTSAWAKAGLMVRETLAADSRHAFLALSVGHGYTFERRINTAGTSVNTSWGGVTGSGWVRLKRTGYTFEAFASPDGVTWTAIGTDTVPMASGTVYVGIAVTSHNAANATTAVLDHLKLTIPAAAPNQPPTVSLTSPVNGAAYTAPANISVSAKASDPENRLARVDFFSGSTKIGSVATAPFSMTWSAVASGTYAVSAEAFDQDGGTAQSATSTITVNAAGVPTGISFQASADHATLVTSYRLDVYASGVNPATATPLKSTSLGKPTPDATGSITVNEATFFAGLATGSYQATVSAIGAAGSSRSAAVTFTR